MCSYAARKNILLQWINERVLTVKGWQGIVFDLVPLEYLTCILHLKTDQFYKVWEPYLNYVKPGVSYIMLQGFSWLLILYMSVTPSIICIDLSWWLLFAFWFLFLLFLFCFVCLSACFAFHSCGSYYVYILYL